MRIFWLGLLFFSFNAFTQTSLPDVEVNNLVQEIDPSFQLSKAEANILKQELKIQTLIIETVKEMELDGVEFKNLAKTEASISDLIDNSIKMKALDLGFRYQERTSNLIKDCLQDSNIQSKLKKIKKFILNDTAIRKNAMMATARRFGIEIGVFYLVAAQIDYTMPIILMASGNVSLGAALYATPFSSTSTSLFSAIRKLVKQRHLIKQLGFSNFKERLNVLKSVRKFLGRNLFKSDYLQHITINQNLYSFTIEDTNKVKRLLAKLGYQDNALNWENLSKFLTEQGKLIERIDELNQTSTPRLAKVLAVLKEIEDTSDLDLLHKMQMRFSTKVNQISSSIHSAQHLSWFVKLSNSPSFDDFFKHLKNFPDDLPARVFGKVWRDFTLGNLARTITEGGTTSTYQAFRKLHDQYDKELKHLFITDAQTTMSKELKNKFIDYIYNATAPVNSCGQIFKMSRGASAPLL